MRKYVLYSHWIVEDSIHDFLVGTSVVCIAIKHFAYTINSSSFIEIRPEVLLDMSDRINTQAINYLIVLVGDL